MSTVHTSPPVPDAVPVPHDSEDGASQPPGGALGERLSVMKAAWTSFSAEIDSELKSICAILRDPDASGASPEPAARWEELPVPQPDHGRSPQDAASRAEARPQGRTAVREEFTAPPAKVALKEAIPTDALKPPRKGDALKGHDRIAALKERLAEKLRCEGERPPTESVRSEVAFATNEEEQS